METLFDIKAVMFNTKAANGLHSVSDGYVGFHVQGNGIRSVWCKEHGAMLCVAVLETGNRLYRCPTCNEGAVKVIY